MNILFYYPSNERTISIESLCIELKKLNHNITMLSIEKKGNLHYELEKNGITTYQHILSTNNKILYYLNHIYFLIQFVKKNNIDLVFSHIQQPNLIASIAQYFSKARFVLCRHHSDSAETNKSEKKADVVINLLGKEFIVPSKKVYTQMVQKEGVNPQKINLIPYGYDFEKYDKPNLYFVKEIREKYKAKMLIVKIARLVPEKRHIVLLKAFKSLIEKGYDVKLLLLSNGIEYEKLYAYCEENNLLKHVFFIGFTTKVIDYLHAADLVVHLSITEASNSLIKEAGLAEKPVILCNGVGDFDDYIVNQYSAIKLNIEDAEEIVEENIIKAYKNSEKYSNLGKNLKLAVLENFEIKKVIALYQTYFK